MHLTCSVKEAFTNQHYIQQLTLNVCDKNKIKRFTKWIILIALSKFLNSQRYIPSVEFTYNILYEGCPSKVWTFVMKRDCLSGIL